MEWNLRESGRPGGSLSCLLRPPSQFTRSQSQSHRAELNFITFTAAVTAPSGKEDLPNKFLVAERKLAANQESGSSGATPLPWRVQMPRNASEGKESEQVEC